MRGLLLLAALGACYRVHGEDCVIRCGTGCPDGLVCGNDGVCSAAGGDTCLNAPAADGSLPQDLCFGSDQRFGMYCFPSLLPALALSSPYDTDACTTGTIDEEKNICIFAAHQVTVPPGIFVVGGSRSFVIVGDMIDVEGKLDLGSSTQTGKIGAGTRKDCMEVATIATGAGGPGGSSATAGGSGGAVFGGAQTTAPPALTFGAPYPLGGGCVGSPGGPNAKNIAMPGGYGGGAVIAVGKRITITGEILVGGAGGSGGADPTGSGIGGGGAGGGTGGLIALDAGEQLTVAGALSAGGGAGGSGASMSFSGNAGGDARSATNATGGGAVGMSGGGGNGCGTNPSTGASITNYDGGDSTSATAGGGGGGASCGFIALHGPSTVTGMTMPTAIVVP